MRTTLLTPFRTLLALMFFAASSAFALERGTIGVYYDQHQGKPTASGERYAPELFTAAHETLPLGTLIRVTNALNGRAVDVRINDRKNRDGRLVYLSGAAGREIGLSPGQSVDGWVAILPPHLTPAAAERTPEAARGAIQQQMGAGGQHFKTQFQRARDRLLGRNQRDGRQFEAGSTTREPGGFFARIFSPKAESVAPAASGQPGYSYGSPTYTPDGRVTPMSAPRRSSAYRPRADAAPTPPRPAPQISPMAPQPRASAPPRQVRPLASSASVPVSSTASYRVQFGAFKKQRHADELSASLNRGGVASMVVQSTANQLYLVVGRNAFPTAGEAQRWIDFEGARRGWRERPVVVR